MRLHSKWLLTKISEEKCKQWVRLDQVLRSKAMYKNLWCMWHILNLNPREGLCKNYQGEIQVYNPESMSLGWFRATHICRVFAGFTTICCLSDARGIPVDIQRKIIMVLGSCGRNLPLLVLQCLYWKLSGGRVFCGLHGVIHCIGSLKYTWVGRFMG